MWYRILVVILSLYIPCEADISLLMIGGELSSSPVTAVVESCNCTQDPLTGCTLTNEWSGQISSGTETQLESNGSSCLVPVSGSGVMQTVEGPNVELAFCESVVGDTRVHVRLQEAGTTNVDGYTLHVVPAQDELRIIERTNNTESILLDDISVSPDTIENGDCFMIRAIGSTLEAHYKPTGGAWRKLTDTTDATISAAGKTALSISSTSARIDFIQRGTLP